MRLAGILLVGVFVCLALPAAGEDMMPEGWSRSATGYTHDESGISCPATIGSYSLLRLEGPAAPTTLGTCVYSGGALRIGQVRVRKFVDGVGETPLAIQNDRGLMGLVPMGGASAGTRPVAAYRAGPGPVIDGTETSQFVLTSVRKGLMMDCIAQNRRDQAEGEFALNHFLTDCSADR
jgi:hypothetical protein